MTMNDRAKWAQFGTELLRFRSSAGITQRQLASRLTMHHTMLGKLERGDRTPQRYQAEELDTALETGGALSRLWQELANQRHIPEWFKSALMLERKAREIRAYDSTVIPGLLQTPAYARSLIRDRRPAASEEEVEELVRTRTGRLPLIIKDARPTLCFVIKESVLLDLVGDEMIMREEMQHIADLMESRTARVQILPDGTKSSIGLCLPFWIYRLSGTQTVAYAEHIKGGQVFDQPDTVEDLRSLFGDLQAESLPPADSGDLVRKVAEDHYGAVD